MTCGPCKSGEDRPRTNKYISVYRLKAGLTVNASGHIDETDSSNWGLYGNFWAAIATKGSKEFARGGEVAAEITHQLTIKYSSMANGITTKMRVNYQGRIFNIAQPPTNKNEENEWLVFNAIEIK